MKASQWMFFGAIVLSVLLVLLGFFCVVRVDYGAEQERFTEALRVRELELAAEGFSKQPDSSGKRIEALEKELRAHKQQVEEIIGIATMNQLQMLEIIEQQEKRIEALEKLEKKETSHQFYSLR